MKGTRMEFAPVSMRAKSLVIGSMVVVAFVGLFIKKKYDEKVAKVNADNYNLNSTLV